MKRKSATIVLTVALIAFSLAGCSLSASDPVDSVDFDSEPSVEPAEPPPATEEPASESGLEPVAAPTQGAGSSGDWDLSQGRWEAYTTEQGLPSDRIGVLAIDENGYLWIGTNNAGGRFDGDDWEDIVPRFVYVTDIAFDEQGRVWMTDGRGVDVYDNGEITTYDYESGLTSVFTEAILADIRGRIWVGIITGQEPAGCIGGVGFGGINLFEDGAWTWIGTEELFGPSVMDLAQDQSGNVWAVGDGGVAMFDGEEWESMTFPGIENMPSITCVAADPSGSTWIGTKQLGVWVWDGTGWTQYTPDDGLAGNTVWTITFDDAGRAWLGTGTGLSIFDGETWTTFTTEDGLTNNDVRALALAPDGAWIGTWRGLSRVVFQD